MNRCCRSRESVRGQQLTDGWRGPAPDRDSPRSQLERVKKASAMLSIRPTVMPGIALAGFVAAGDMIHSLRIRFISAQFALKDERSQSVLDFADGRPQNPVRLPRYSA
jgi:hypothetical protein